MRTLVVLLVAACGAKAPTQAPQPEVAQNEAPPVVAEPPKRIDYLVGESPMSLVVTAGRLVWTDSAGAIWMMPTTADSPYQLSEQHSHGFMFHPVVVGGDVFVSTKRDFVRVGLRDAKVTKLGLALPEDPVDVVARDRDIVTTLFKRDAVLAIDVGAGKSSALFSMPRAVLAAHRNVVYAVSYSTGVLRDATAGRTIARGFIRATALAADDTHAFVYTETDKTLRRVELATGKTEELTMGLDNSDDIVADGAYLYTFSWPNKLVRVAKDGSGTEVLADDLKSPTHIAVDADAVYVVSRDQNKIVRLPKIAP